MKRDVSHRQDKFNVRRRLKGKDKISIKTVRDSRPGVDRLITFVCRRNVSIKIKCTSTKSLRVVKDRPVVDVKE